MPESVLGYLPHQPPMVLIDELVDAGDDYAVSRLVVTEHTPFVSARGLPAWAGIELMAQTVSLFSGVRSHRQGIAPRVGFLLGTKSYECSCSFFPIHSQLIIHVKERYFGKTRLGVFECSIQCEAGEAVAKLNVYEPLDLAQILDEQKA